MKNKISGVTVIPYLWNRIGRISYRLIRETSTPFLFLLVLATLELVIMKEIKLSQEGKNRGKYVALVDDWNYDWLNGWRWSVYKNGEIRYARRMEFNGVKHKSIYMHEQILNPPEGYESEHKDRNGLNNQEFNLRNATHQQNQLNRNTWGRSKYKGVTFHKAKLKKGDCEYIQGQIKISGKHKSLGFFKTEEAAALAYNEAAKKYLGEFAYLNIIN